MNPGKPEQRMQQNLYPQSLTGSSSVCERTPEKPSHSLPVIRPFFHWANMCWYTPDAEHPVKWGEWNWMPCSYSEGLVVCERETLSSVQPLSHVWLRPHWSQHTRLPFPSPTPRACSHSCPSHWWGHPNISSSVVPFPSCLQSFPESGYFRRIWFFTWSGQSIGASVSASVSILPKNIQDWFLLGWTGWISLQSKGLSRVFCNTTAEKYQLFGAQLSL